MSNSDEPNLELLLGEDKLSQLFISGFVSSSVNPVGYDLRLANKVGHVTTGQTDELNDQEVVIYPGETIIVCTEEVLNLPDNVFALGSPKMSLLIKGLWAHGGKTDFGYNHNLLLGFQNVGSEPIKIKKGQQIFHLTFFKVHNTATQRYAARGPDWPALKQSVLESQNSIINEQDLQKIKETDGVKIFEVCKQIISLNNKLNYLYYIPFISLIIIVTSLSFKELNWLSAFNSSLLISVAAAVAILTGVYKFIKGIIDWRKQDKKNRG
jgi:deoxycytidine triphosphate deaminase